MSTHGIVSSGITAGLVATAVFVAALQGRPSSADDPACSDPRAEASRLIHEGDTAAGASLALQTTDRAAYQRASRAAAWTELQGFWLIAAHRDCFRADERAGLDAQIAHLEHLTGSVAVHRQDNGVLMVEGDDLLVSYDHRQRTEGT